MPQIYEPSAECGLNGQSSGLEPGKASKFIDRFARGSPGIDRRSLVGIAERHAAEEHQSGGKREEGAERLVQMRPGFLRAGTKPVGAGEQHPRLGVAAEIR